MARKKGTIGINQTTQKILLLLLGGFALGLTYSPKRQFKIAKDIAQEWREINRRTLQRKINALYEAKLITEQENPDGTMTITLTDEGKKKALTYDLEHMFITQVEKWDGKWRIVLFDIPEERKKVRDSFRFHLKKLGFLELQKSVFVYPHNCKNEIDFLIEFYQVRSHVRFVIAEEIDNKLHLKKLFNIA